MVSVFMLYSEQPDSERYEQHLARSRELVPGTTMRHGRVLGARWPIPTLRVLRRVRVPGQGRVRKAAQDGAHGGR